VLHGRLQEWYEGGQPMCDWNYEHGKEHGSVISWKWNGRLEKDTWYVHGALWRRRQAQREFAAQGGDVLIAALLGLAAGYL
jgi:antitoxin component YwqK of YwqJK toxin-antitoxin module